MSRIKQLVPEDVNEFDELDYENFETPSLRISLDESPINAEAV